MDHSISFVVPHVNKDGVTISEFLKKRIWILDAHGIRQLVVLKGVTA